MRLQGSLMRTGLRLVKMIISAVHNSSRRIRPLEEMKHGRIGRSPKLFLQLLESLPLAAGGCGKTHWSQMILGSPVAKEPLQRRGPRD